MYMALEDGLVMGLCALLHTPALTKSIDHPRSKTVWLCDGALSEYTICSQSVLQSF